MAALPKGERERYSEYLICARYLEFLDLRNTSALWPPRHSIASDDAQILRSLEDCLREGLNECANLPAWEEAQQIHDAVLAAPGENLAKEIKALITSVPAFVEKEADRVHAFSFCYEGWAGHPHSMLELPLTTWEQSELKRLGKGMHVWTGFRPRSGPYSATSVNETLLVKCNRRLEQIRLRESLRQAIHKLFGDFGKDGSSS